MTRNNMFTNKNYEEVVAKACFLADDFVDTPSHEVDYVGFFRVIVRMTQALAALQGVCLSVDIAKAIVAPKVAEMRHYDVLRVEDADSPEGQEELLNGVDDWVEYLAALVCATLSKRVA